MFKKILIANRGEIAIRVMRAARELGIESVAVYHNVDSSNPHVQFADYAYELIADTPKAGYLDINQIIKIAKESGAEAIHPGYGFLSENAKFSQACIDAGIQFIGPKPESIEAMGSKTEARKLMAKANVPTVPGYNEKVKDDTELIELAKKIGYPVLLKAAAGGGGKGMRLVEDESMLIESYQSAQREALKSFGDDLVYMEKFIVNPKHIEIQVIADNHGNCVYLAERDCSIQRRHQKVIEEAPSTILDEDLRRRMGEVAVNAAKACGYVNAGTIEFLVDINKDFYFLEMNTRLQVEHPVTELITSIDLAKEQIMVAAGFPLSFKQDDIKITGHAIECRIYAEDPLNNFMPDTGKITYNKEPGGFGVRVDGGIEWGGEVSIHFDPMLTKLIVYGKDRIEAIDKMNAALEGYKVTGFVNIIPFLQSIMQNPIFRNEYFDTGFIGKHYDFHALEATKDNKNETVAAITAFFSNKLIQNVNTTSRIPQNNYVQQGSNWKLKGRM